MPNLLSDMPKLDENDIAQISLIIASVSPRSTRAINPWDDIAFMDKEKLYEKFVEYYTFHYPFRVSCTSDTFRKLFGERSHVKKDK